MQSITNATASEARTAGVPTTGVPATGVPATGVPATGVPAKQSQKHRTRTYIKLLTFLLTTLGVAPWSAAQNFRSDTLNLPLAVDTIVAVELTQDQWLDYWIAGTDPDGQRGYWIYQNLENSTFALRSVPAVALSSATFAFADLNRDNQLDVVVSGRTAAGEPLTQVYYNQDGNFSAPPLIVNRIQAHTLGCADFNRDGRVDIFLNGRSATDSVVAQLYLNADDGFVSPETGVSPIASGKTLLFDWDNDGRIDILQSGSSPTGETVTELYQNYGKFPYESYDIGLPPLAATALATGDVNHDGRADLLLAGRNAEGEAVTYLYEYRDSVYAPVNIELPPTVASFATLADYNHDGLTDLGLVGEEASGIPVARWYFQSDAGWTTETYDSLATPGTAWAVGDINNDGHLDVLRGGTAASATLLLTNQSPGNNSGPSASEDPMVSAIDTLTVFSWTPVADDRTNPLAFTYEMYVLPEDTSQYALSPEYRDTTKARVDHGRVGYNTMYTLNGLPEGTYYWNVVAVDNSFQSGAACAGWGSGSGTGAGGEPLCFTIARDDTTVCVGTTLRLTTAQPVSWIGNRNGDLEETPELTYVVRGDDVLYYTAFSDTACALTYSLRIRALPAETNDLLATDTTVCANETLTLAVDSTYTTVTWFSATQGELATGNELTWTASQVDTLWVAAQTGDQCPVWDTLTVALFPPVALLSEDTLTVTVGALATLSASGAETYRWSPAAGLNRTDVADPTTAPSETTTYVVTGTTADGCIATDTMTVIVLVESPPTTSRLFVPNLFSPNGDGQNDDFRLYGENIRSITWQIYDRQGTRLFEADRPEAGWDGQYQGRDLPTGVYVWKLAGQHADGTPLRFEGEQSGLLRLVR